MKGWKRGENQKQKGTKVDPSSAPMFKKKSIFYKNLSYWEHLEFFHSIDAIHIIKIVCESIIGTLLDITFKTKYGLKSWQDLTKLKIRK